MVDESSGPATKREYRVATVPTGDALIGRTVDFLGRVPGASQAYFVGMHNVVPAWCWFGSHTFSCVRADLV